MIKFNLAKIDNDVYFENLKRKEEVYNKFNNSKMIGWTRDIDISLITDILKLRDEIKKEASCLVVIGIGGSYLGSYALNNIFR